MKATFKLIPDILIEEFPYCMPDSVSSLLLNRDAFGGTPIESKTTSYVKNSKKFFFLKHELIVCRHIITKVCVRKPH